MGGSDKYNEKEAQDRFEAALQGAMRRRLSLLAQMGLFEAESSHVTSSYAGRPRYAW
jgi:hypothetical protein